MKKINAKKFDEAFDNGEDILPYIDLSSKMTLEELRLKCLACAAAHNKSEARRNSL